MTPHQWITRPLGELVDVLDHRRIPVNKKERASRQGSIPYYGATGQVGWIDDALFDEPLLLLGEDGVQFFDRGKPKAYLVDGPAWVNNHAHVLRVRDSFADRRFLMYQMNWMDYHGYANGTTRLKLTKSAMTRMPIRLPALAQQRRIVEILEDHLSRLDAAEAALRRTPARLASFKASAAIHALRPSAESGAGTVISFGAIELPLSPAWRASTVGDEAVLVEYGSGAKAAPLEGVDAVPVLRMGNVKDGRVVWDSLKYLPADHPDVTKLRLRPGDLLFNRTNSADLVGKSAVFDGDRGATFASYLIRARFAEDVNPHWANLVINSPYGRAYVDSVVSQQVGQANVNGTKLRAFPLPVPPRGAQDQIVAWLREQDQAVHRIDEQMERSITQIEVLRRSLLTAAFSGRLTGRASDEEVVQELAGV